VGLLSRARIVHDEQHCLLELMIEPLEDDEDLLCGLRTFPYLLHNLHDRQLSARERN
jgi:hypothetical protein